MYTLSVISPGCPKLHAVGTPPPKYIIVPPSFVSIRSALCPPLSVPTPLPRPAASTRSSSYHN